ncbi:MAG: UDP-galactopyranose mutase, partial [Nanoarchaeota archaeon]
KRLDDSYENFLINRFGKTLYNLSFRDYAFKIWNSDPQELDKELAKRRVAVSGIFELIKSVLLRDTKKISAEYFYYPENGLNQLFESIVAKIKENNGKLLLNTPISEISLKNNTINYIKFNNLKIKPDYIISTIHLDNLAKIIKPANQISDDSLITYQKLNIIYFILNKKRAMKDCWVFFPEKKFIFQRVSEQKAFSEKTGPKDKTAIMVETTQQITEELMAKVIEQLESAGILKKDEIEEHFVKSIPKAYPVYKKGFLENFKKTELFFDSIENFYLLGRQGLFNYNNMDQCWDMAMKVAEQIKNNKTKEDWQITKRYFESYRIVD